MLLSIKNVIIVVLLSLVAISCKKSTDVRVQAEKLVPEWVGKTIVLPGNLQAMEYVPDGVERAHRQAEYKVLLYVDSAGCSSCRLKLHEWSRLIAEADSTMTGRLSFLFFFQPKNRNEMLYLLRANAFSYPVYIDENKELDQLNKFPNNPSFQCFLLDANNKILSIGNPTENPKIWDLYKEIVSGELAHKPTETTVEVANKTIDIQTIKTNKKHHAKFSITNTGSSPLLVHTVQATCGCTVPAWDKKPIAPGKTTEITVEIRMKDKGYFNKNITVHSNAAQSPLLLTIKGNAE